MIRNISKLIRDRKSIALVAILTAFSSQANKIEDCFHKAALNQLDYSIYIQNYCSENVKRLFEVCFLDSKGVEFLVLTPYESYQEPALLTARALERLTPENSRVEKTDQSFEPWIYHVVLRYDNRIYDLDYRTLEEGLEPVEYFEKMFPGQKNLFVRAYDPFEYYRSRQTINFLLNGTKPAITSTEYLKSADLGLEDLPENSPVDSTVDSAGDLSNDFNEPSTDSSKAQALDGKISRKEK